MRSLKRRNQPQRIFTHEDMISFVAEASGKGKEVNEKKLKIYKRLAKIINEQIQERIKEDSGFM